MKKLILAIAATAALVVTAAVAQVPPNRSPLWSACPNSYYNGYHYDSTVTIIGTVVSDGVMPNANGCEMHIAIKADPGEPAPGVTAMLGPPSTPELVSIGLFPGGSYPAGTRVEIEYHPVASGEVYIGLLVSIRILE